MKSRVQNNNKATTNSGWEDEQCVSTFDEMFLDEELLRGIYGHGWEDPSPIQQRAIVPVKNGKDVLAQAQSGTGKTGAFTIGTLSIVDRDAQVTQVVILSPTRELADQTYNVMSAIATYMNGLKIVRCVGGTPTRENREQLRQNPHVVVGTPGRINHMASEGSLRLDRLSCFVLDEADELMNRGFRDCLIDIFETSHENVQVCLFSATYTPEVIEIAERIQRDPVKILVKNSEVTLDGIKQFYVNCEREKFKFDVLKDLYECISIQQLIIFVNTKRKTEDLYSWLTAEDFTVSHIHGAMTTEERQLKMAEFRRGGSRVLISTDLLARGINVQNVGVVINYDLPHKDFSNYIHRIGRSGRHGKKGLAINFVTDIDDDARTIHGLQEYYSTKIEELPQDIADCT